MANFVKDIFISRPIKDLSIYEPMLIQYDQSVDQAVDVLKLNNIGSALVVDELGLMLGIITERDIIRKVIGNKEIANKTIAEIMTSALITIKDTSSVGRAIFDMHAERIRHLPIVQNKAYAVGVISAKDIVDYIYRISVKTHERLTKIQRSMVTAFLKNNIKIFKPTKATFVSPKLPIIDAIKILNQNNLGSLVVCDDQKNVLGIITERDIVKKLSNLYELHPSALVSSFMTHKPIVLKEDSLVAEAFRLMSEGKFRHLPIVDSKEQLSGILSVRDFLNYLAEGIVQDLSANINQKKISD